MRASIPVVLGLLLLLLGVLLPVLLLLLLLRHAPCQMQCELLASRAQLTPPLSLRRPHHTLSPTPPLQE